ncbi:MAG: alcohol dehydrogenase catalytic domain-containing protein [Lachnospiraceae bacterium]|nr:alcohol dehydrogenase catalytic domain-containing protein [Lachnospiraceae bacterium]
MKIVRINRPCDFDDQGRITQGYVSVEEAQPPVRRPGEVLLKILYGGICGSDNGSYKGSFAYAHYPLIPGHEFSAQIVDVDEDNPCGLKKGMIVTCNPYMNCGHCYSDRHGTVNACMNNQTLGCQRDGAFREYFTIPQERCIDGKGMDPKTLAAIEPLCISWHGVSRAAIHRGERVLIVGAGTIGLLAAFAAKYYGAEVTLCDIIPQKLERALKMGAASHVIFNDPADPGRFMREVGEQTGWEDFVDGGGNAQHVANGFDVTIEAVGLPSTFQCCIDAACYGGRVVLIGVASKPLDFAFNIIQKKELAIYGSRNAKTEDFRMLIDLVNGGKLPLDQIVTHLYELEDAPRAFEDLNRFPDEVLKAMIHFGDPQIIP